MKMKNLEPLKTRKNRRHKKDCGDSTCEAALRQDWARPTQAEVHWSGSHRWKIANLRWQAAQAPTLPGPRQVHFPSPLNHIPASLQLIRHRHLDAQTQRENALCVRTAAATDSASAVADQARKAHVGLPTRGRGPRGRGPRPSSRVGASSMKLGASKLGKTGDEFFEF